MKILNLYAGIGGNRKLWGDEHDITAVEFDPAIAEAYKSRFPNDTMVVGDAKQYLLDHYKEFDFIWASPPCQTHSRARRGRVDVPYPNGNSYGAVYPDMSIYEIKILFDNFFDGTYCIENVIPYYTPIIPPTVSIDRHYYWANFNISKIEIEKKYRIQDVNVKMIRNQVDCDVGKYILDCAMGTVQHKQGGLF